MPRSNNTPVNNECSKNTESQEQPVVKKVVKKVRVTKQKKKEVQNTNPLVEKQENEVVEEEKQLQNNEKTNMNSEENINIEKDNLVEEQIDGNDNLQEDDNDLIENDHSDDNKMTGNKKKKYDKEKYIAKWDYLFENYATELKTRKQPNQSHSLLKFLSALKNETFKLMKLRKRNNDNKVNSGFMKPVRVSKELETFMDIKDQDKDKPITRVRITQALCEYIKKNSLQNPEDRRNILPDEKLKKLFDIKPETEDSKLTYYSIQKAIQSHIFRLD